MARINIEDSIYKDIRFSELQIKLGSLDRALGAMVRAWTLAQNYWNTENKMIPLEDWDSQRMENAIIAVGLAEVHGGHVYVKGSEKSFQWIQQKSMAGSKSANGRQRTSNGRWENVQRTSTSISSSSSSSSSISSSNSGSISKKVLKKVEKDSPTALLWGTYEQSFKTRWQKDPPPRNAKVNSCLKKLLQDFGEEKALGIIKHYFEMKDAYYQKNFHPVTLMVSQSHQIYSSLSTGLQMSNKEFKEIDASNSFRNKLDLIRQGKI